ncbi:enoyl-CoA hydratase-related protein [Pararoseomonas sp. SCSIO 73927]|uniref:enoyl-CoA hydratase/isomerase family protein n=1 Tax=Pararoseomonas sp. SCSIO 73927 TaxID=3114537 RepID=UPI0030D52465
MGLIPAVQFAHLPRIIGCDWAFDLLFTGRRFEAVEAAAMGLVSRVVPDDALEAARALAADFASKPPVAMRLGQTAFMRANDLDYRRSVASAVEDFCYLATTDEAQEGLSAFLEKREPSWRR